MPIDEQLFMNDPYERRKPNADFLRDHLLREGRLTEEQALTIVRMATAVLSSEPNVLKVRSPVTGALSSILHVRSSQTFPAYSCRGYPWAVCESLCFLRLFISCSHPAGTDLRSSMT